MPHVQENANKKLNEESAKFDIYQQLYGEDYKTTENGKHNERLSGKNLSQISHTELNSTNTMLVTQNDFRNRSQEKMQRKEKHGKHTDKKGFTDQKTSFLSPNTENKIKSRGRAINRIENYLDSRV
jgi:hypothetical protein